MGSVKNNVAPLLLDEILRSLSSLSRKPLFFLDGTFGRGGHTRAFMEAFPQLKVCAVDRDLEAIQFGKKSFSQEIKESRIQFFHFDFKGFLNFVMKKSEEEIKSQISLFNSHFDSILLDLGPSLFQLNQPHRGFSFYFDGPLDMRMNQNQDFRASDIINFWKEKDLLQLFREFGEIRKPRKLVRFLIQERKKKVFESTKDLSLFIERVEGWSKRGEHPSTRYFMALRMKVNDELKQIEDSLLGFVELLRSKGRLHVISFHSLEDRLVKNAFKKFEEKEKGQVLTKKVVQASWEEKKRQPRLRSAKLRIFEKN